MPNHLIKNIYTQVEIKKIYHVSFTGNPQRSDSEAAIAAVTTTSKVSQHPNQPPSTTQ